MKIKHRSKFGQILLILIILLVGCTDNYKEGVKSFKENNFDKALIFFRNVENSDENYSKAQIKISEIDSLLTQIQFEKARQDSIAVVEKEKKELEDFKAQLSREIESLKSFDGSKYRDEVSAIQIEIVLFGAWAKFIKDTEKHTNGEIKKLGQTLKLKVKSLQKVEYPKMRKNYGEILKQKLWAENIKVKTKDNGYATLEFEGGIFASNKNKQDFQETLSEILNQLRFKRINYKWYEYDDEYTYYSLKTLQDSELTNL